MITAATARPQYDLLVVGASVAGFTAARTFADANPDRHVLLIDRARTVPHDKPPLSKQVLAGQWAPQRAHFAEHTYWHEQVIDLCLDTPAQELTAEGVVADGQLLHSAATILAPGCEPRTLPLFDDASNALTIRTLPDAIRLRALTASAAQRVVIIGAGFMGLEVASVLSEYAAAAVTVVEPAAQPLAHVLGGAASDWVLRRHRRRGVEFRLGAAVADVQRGPDGDITALCLTDGSTLPCDVVVIGIGVYPATRWLDPSPLSGLDGIVCDEELQTAVPGVFAAGDAARFYNPVAGMHGRIEHWSTAAAHGRLAARNAGAYLAGAALDCFADLPYVWTDQAGARLQILGSPAGCRHFRVDTMTDDQLLVTARTEGRLAGAIVGNSPKAAALLRRELLDQPRPATRRYGVESQAVTAKAT